MKALHWRPSSRPRHLGIEAWDEEPLPAPHNPIWTTVTRLLLFTAVFLAGYHVLRIGDQNISFSDVAFLLAALILLMRGGLSAMPFGSLTALWLIFLGLMLGSLFLGTVINGDVSRWLIIALQYMVGWLLIPMVLMSEERMFLRRLVLAFVLGVTAMEATGVLASLLLPWSAANELFGAGFLQGNGRLGSFAGEANWNGAMIASALPMLVYVVHKRLLPPLVGIGAAVILVWGLLLSASFSGFMASAVAVTIMLGLLGPRHLLRFSIAIAVIGAGYAMSGAPVPEIFAKRVGGALASGDVSQAGTFSGRAELIGEAWDLAEEHLIIGVGADGYRDVSAQGQPVHNLYLLMWTEGGGFALIGLVGMLAMLIIMAGTGLQYDRSEGAMALSVIFVFLAYTVSSPHMFSRLWIFPMMVALGTIFARNPRYQARKSAQSRNTLNQNSPPEAATIG